MPNITPESLISTPKKCAYFECENGREPTRLMLAESAWGEDEFAFYWCHKRCHAKFGEGEKLFSYSRAVSIVAKMLSTPVMRWPLVVREHFWGTSTLTQMRNKD